MTFQKGDQVLYDGYPYTIGGFIGEGRLIGAPTNAEYVWLLHSDGSRFRAIASAILAAHQRPWIYVPDAGRCGNGSSWVPYE